MEKVLLNNSRLQAREEILSGKRYLVAPVSMLVPGVLSGSQGSLYYPEEEVTKNPGAWNGMPLTLGHPVNDNGDGVSARSPKVLEKYELGTVFNTTTAKGKLDGEAWFDKEKLMNLAPSLAERLISSQPIELSTGLFVKRKSVSNGLHKGKPYNAVARDYQPDHLAILLDKKGACSLEDGCGVLVNEEEEEKFIEGVLFKELPDDAVLDEVFENEEGTLSAYVESDEGFILLDLPDNLETNQKGPPFSSGKKKKECKCGGKCDECKEDLKEKKKPTTNDCPISNAGCGASGGKGKRGFQPGNTCNGKSKGRKSKGSSSKGSSKKRPKGKGSSTDGGLKRGADGKLRDSKGKFAGGKGKGKGKPKGTSKPGKPKKKSTIQSKVGLQETLGKLKKSATDFAVRT